MITKILRPTIKNIKITAEILKRGGIIIYPTESSYAIGCDYTNKKAIRKLMKIKKRLLSKHTTVIVDSIKTAEKYAKLNNKEKLLVKGFMPGPLTICAKNDFNFRISSNKTANALAKIFGKPIVTTSANISGEPAIYNPKELKNFIGKVDVIIDAGKLAKREPSTIVKVGKEIKILRNGPIKEKEIKNKLI
jgi:L-threonylcarbamoyladenylate synthase